MAYHKNLNLRYDVTLPIRDGPVRFGVLDKNGLSSNAWGVYVESSGDIYLVCRDHMKETKVSLHQSGKQHFGFPSESGLETAEGGRFWDEWSEPQFQKGSKVVPSYSLLFPSWALGLTKAVRDANPKVWNKNQVFVEAAESPEATIVSLVITDSDAEFAFKTNGEVQSFPLAVLPVRADRKLWVIARQGPEGNMKELAAHGILGINADRVAKLRDVPSGHV
ncbi:MAG: hypothetical protein F4Y50_05475, partial [Dehalococcoidia bacterium]|nr:hypothetical protein [Dehalococcoidia bacterium]